MNEDLRPCLDIESEWEAVQEMMPIYIYKHKMYPSLYRCVDFGLEEVYFRDKDIVKIDGIIDIYKKLEAREKEEIIGFIRNLMHEIKPINLPYVPFSYKVYVEHEKKASGILYFKDNDEDESIVPIKRFFEISRDPILNFEEISWDKFREIAEEVEDGADK